MFSNLTKDIRRYVENNKHGFLFSIIECLLFESGFQAIISYRMAHFLKNKRAVLIPEILKKFALVFTGIEIEPRAMIGPGLLIVHGTGVVIGDRIKIGKNAIILQGVTIGMGDLYQDTMATVGDGATIGTGAKVLGNIKIGDGVTIGANSVVINSVPDHATVIGITARIVMIN